jgi:hypothetical protein
MTWQVLSGFTSAAAVIIFMSQLKSLFRISASGTCTRSPYPRGFFAASLARVPLTHRCVRACAVGMARGGGCLYRMKGTRCPSCCTRWARTSGTSTCGPSSWAASASPSSYSPNGLSCAPLPPLGVCFCVLMPHNTHDTRTTHARHTTRTEQVHETVAGGVDVARGHHVPHLDTGPRHTGTSYSPLPNPP